MKIFVDGVEARPVASDPVFDVGSANLPFIGAPRSIDRTIRVGAGPHVVQVMIGTGAGTTFLLSNWSLIVERAAL